MQFEEAVQPGQHTLAPLPYAYNALEPVLSARSVRMHHDILQQKYVDQLNRAEIQLADARRDSNFDLIYYWANELAFQGSGVILHSIYWSVMTSPGRGGEMGTHTKSEIINYFGDVPSFMEQFAGTANKIEGSSWAILTWQPTWHRLEILQAQKHQDGTQWSGIPILVLDVWEHAYLPDYGAERAEYIKKWWSLVNWAEVERRLADAMEGRVSLTV